MIDFTCPCGRQLRARDEDAGKQCVCPACKQVSVIPAGGAAAPEPTAVQPPQPPSEPRSRRRDEVQSDAPDDRDRGRYDEEDDRPRRRRRDYEEDETPRRRRREEEGEGGTSGKAVTSLILGLTSLFCLLNVLTGLPSILLAVLAFRDIGKSRERLGGKGMAVAGIVLSSIGILLLPFMWLGYLKVRETSTRITSQNNLKQIGLAIHAHHDVTGRLPVAVTRSPDGRPLHSWRTTILPYIEQDNLYRRLNHQEPWNSPANSWAQSTVVKTYVLPGKDQTPTQTYYQTFQGPRTAMGDVQPRGIANITDGTSNTIFVVEAAAPVLWVSPQDIPFDPNGAPPTLGNHWSGGTNVLMGDGSVRFVRNLRPDMLRAAITADGGEPVFLD